MDHFKIVLPEHLNDYGSLFGGTLLKWIDEIAYIRVSLDYPGKHFVTVSLDDAIFKHRICKGQILRFNCQQKHLGNTSVSYQVKVYGARYEADDERILFENTITFVRVDSEGVKQRIFDSPS